MSIFNKKQPCSNNCGKEIKKWYDSWERFDMIDKALKYLEEKNG
jgi:hypothetical protein